MKKKLFLVLSIIAVFCIFSIIRTPTQIKALTNEDGVLTDSEGNSYLLPEYEENTRLPKRLILTNSITDSEGNIINGSGFDDSTGADDIRNTQYSNMFNYYGAELDSEAKTLGLLVDFDIENLDRNNLQINLKYQKGLTGEVVDSIDLTADDVFPYENHLLISLENTTNILEAPYYYCIKKLTLKDNTSGKTYNYTTNVNFYYVINDTWLEVEAPTHVIQTSMASGSAWDNKLFWLIQPLAISNIVLSQKDRTIATFKISDLSGNPIPNLQKLTSSYKINNVSYETTLDNQDKELIYMRDNNQKVSSWDSLGTYTESKTKDGFLGLASERYIDKTLASSDNFKPSYMWAWNYKVQDLEFIKCTYIKPAGQIVNGSFYENALHVESITDESGTSKNVIVDGDGNIDSNYEPLNENSSIVVNKQTGEEAPNNTEANYVEWRQPGYQLEEIKEAADGINISSLFNSNPLTAFIGAFYFVIIVIVVFKVFKFLKWVLK